MTANRLLAVQEQFQNALGAQELSTSQQADLYHLVDAIALPATDPFWAIVAFLYARTPDNAVVLKAMDRMAGALQALQQKSAASQDVLQKLVGQIEQIAQQPIPEDVSAPADSSPDDTLSKSIDELLAALKMAQAQASRHPFKEWLIDRFEGRHALYGGMALTAMLLLVGAGGYWAGSAAVPDAAASQRVQLTAAQRWATSGQGLAMYRFAKINADSLQVLLTCGWKGAVRETQGKYTACYPSGAGAGYYIPDQGTWLQKLF